MLNSRCIYAQLEFVTSLLSCEKSPEVFKKISDQSASCVRIRADLKLSNSSWGTATEHISLTLKFQDYNLLEEFAG